MKNNTNNLPLVVIFGRTNVGKSTLFNCLIEEHQALVSDSEGTTRDSNSGEVSWQKKSFKLVDTGGIIDINHLLNPGTKSSKVDDIQSRIEEQANAYLQKADLIIFLVDNKAGLLPQDKQLSLLLKKVLPDLSKVILVANKVDSFKRDSHKAADFNKLSLGEPVTVSAATGSGTGDLLDLIIKKIPEQKPEEPQAEEKVEKEIKVIMIGKPNVGKSSLLNSILGEERVIVSPIAHTTREPQNTFLTYKNKTIKLIDTAGINRKGQQAQKKEDKQQLERYGIEKSLDTLREADIALLVIDVNEDLTHQDSKIVEEIVERQKSIIIIANKWDLIEEKDTKKQTNKIYGDLPFIQYAPILFVSAKTGSKVNKVLDLILTISEQRKKEISESILNTFMMKLVKLHKPPKGKGTKYPHVHKFEQLHVNPPAFELRIGANENLQESYLNFVSNKLREKFGFLGTPIRIWITKNRKIHGKAEMSAESKKGKKPVRHARRIIRYH